MIREKLSLVISKNKDLKDPLNFMFLRGDIYTLLSMLVKDYDEQREQSLMYKYFDEDEQLPKGVSRH